jgi:hypothetical protein
MEARQSEFGEIDAFGCWLGLFNFWVSFSADGGLGEPHWEMNDSTGSRKLARANGLDSDKATRRDREVETLRNVFLDRRA